MRIKAITNVPQRHIDITFETPRPGYASVFVLREASQANKILADVHNSNGGARLAENICHALAAVPDLVEVLRYARTQFQEFKNDHGAGRFHAWNMLDDAIKAYEPLADSINKP